MLVVAEREQLPPIEAKAGAAHLSRTVTTPWSKVSSPSPQERERFAAALEMGLNGGVCWAAKRFSLSLSSLRERGQGEGEVRVRPSIGWYW